MLRFLKLNRCAIDEALWQSVVEALPVVGTLGESEANRLRALAEAFAHTKYIEGAGGFEVTDQAVAIVACLACIPILELGIDAYSNLRTIVVYPGAFIACGTTVDDAGVEHDWNNELSGESWMDGPVILSWNDVVASGYLDAYNVVIHEMAHELDMLSGDANGCPVLHAEMDSQTWCRAFGDAYEDMCAKLEAGLATEIDEYAAQSPEEFFAVASEYFFEAPQALIQSYPEVYAQLRAFYRQHPLERVMAFRQH